MDKTDLIRLVAIVKDLNKRNKEQLFAWGKIEDELTDAEKVELRNTCWTLGFKTPKSLSYNYTTQKWL